MKSLSLIMAVLVATTLQASFAFDWGDGLAPLSAYLPNGDPCHSVNCGNGTCTNTTDYPFVKCVCNAGWKQPSIHHEFPFQPCVIPNCTIDYNCSNPSMSSAEAPAPSDSHFINGYNPFDPCSHAICGGGNCVRKSNTTFDYQCECYQGYANVMKWDWGFCARECELQRDCSRIGISVSNDSTATNGSSSSSSDAHGGLKFIADNSGLVSGSILATLIVLLFK